MTEVKRVYFDVVIENGRYHIVESSEKPKKKGSAISVLAKIEEILKKNLQYSDLYQDNYSQLSKEDLLKVFQTKSNEISQGAETKYKKHKKYNWILKKIFGKDSLSIVKATNARIRNLTAHGKIFPSLPNEMIQEIAKHIGTFDLASLAAVNRHGQARAEPLLLKRAQEIGYQGSSIPEAKQYLKDFFREFDRFCHGPFGGFVPQKYRSFKTNQPNKKTIDLEKALQHLKGLTTEEIFDMWMWPNSDIYSFHTLRKAFSIERHSNVSKNCSLAIKEKGNKALFASTAHGAKEIIKLLLHHGVDIDARNHYWQTPLAVAASNGNKEIMELLIQNGANVNTIDTRGNTPLIRSIREADSLEAARLLLAAGASASINQVSSNDASIGSALHSAVRRGKPEFIELLLQHGADINLRDKDQQTPLALAVISGRTEIVELLIKKGADVNTVNIRGNTPLINSTAGKDSSQIARLLLEAGATQTIDHVSHTANVGSALHSAIWQKNMDLVKLLLQFGANINLRDRDGLTPLGLAKQLNRSKIAKLLSLNNASN